MKKTLKQGLCALLVLALLPGGALAAEQESLRQAQEQVAEAAVLDEGWLETGAPAPATAAEIAISAPSAVLMEQSSGALLYEKEAHTPREPASVTKVMSLLLFFEAIDGGALSLEDVVTCSAHASSMGGSQIYLEEGEQMTVHELLKAVVVASANDATVALAEHLAGTEEAFVAKMNEKAAALGMEDSHFTNTTGLMDDPSHVSSAYDIALMSRALLEHEGIYDYTTIWMDSVRNGEFGLANTNKLIRYYDGATGLKTGFTQAAGYCLAASAEREGMSLIAVVLGDETSTGRFESAKTLLNYGFAGYALYPVTPDAPFAPIPVELGKAEAVAPLLQSQTPVLLRKEALSGLEKVVELPESLQAPVEAGQVLGKLTLCQGEEVLAEIPIVAAEGVERLGFWDIYLNFVKILALRLA